MRRGRTSWPVIARRLFLTVALTALTPFTYAQSEYAAAWGPDVGSSAPMLSALDQDGNGQTLESLTGTGGLLLVFNRSVDW